MSSNYEHNIQPIWQNLDTWVSRILDRIRATPTRVRMVTVTWTRSACIG